MNFQKEAQEELGYSMCNWANFLWEQLPATTIAAGCRSHKQKAQTPLKA
jgi:hypothetical protein